ncbi:MAG: glycosyltransferase family 2 protein [Patescibacteria group bacterium]
MKISIVIPWYNTEWLAEKNLPNILSALKNPKNHIIEIIVVDDSSSDNSVTIIKSLFPEVKVIRHKVNRGFSASVNTGVRMARGDIVCLLNSDVLPKVNFLESVLIHFKNSKLFAVSLNEAGSFGWAKGFFRDGFIGHEPGGKGESPHSTFWVSGGSGVFRRDLWTKLGGMDETLFSPFYWEDLDLSYRAMKRGYQLIWEPKGMVEHKHETTIKKLPQGYVNRIRERNQLFFIWKNLGSPNLLRKSIVGVIKRIFSHPGYARIVLMALVKIRPLLKARLKEKLETKVSDEAIFSRF